MNASSSLTVRRASRQDADLVLTMVRELADHQDQGEHVTITVERWRELLGDDAVIVLVAEQKRQAVGYVSAVRRPHLWSGEDILVPQFERCDPEVRQHRCPRALLAFDHLRGPFDRYARIFGLRPSPKLLLGTPDAREDRAGVGNRVRRAVATMEQDHSPALG